MQLSTVVSDVGLHVREAHVFSTDDGFSLDAFLVDGWKTEDTEELCDVIEASLEAYEVMTTAMNRPLPVVIRVMRYATSAKEQTGLQMTGRLRTRRRCETCDSDSR